MEKNMDNSQDERNRKRKIDDPIDDENKKREERLQKARARSKRYREKKKNEEAALVMGGLTDADIEKREERLRYDREKSKRYREKKKKEVAALSVDAAHSSSDVSCDSSGPKMKKERHAAHSSSDFSSDSSSSKMKKERQKQNSKRYRDKIRTLNLITQAQRNINLLLMRSLQDFTNIESKLLTPYLSYHEPIVSILEIDDDAAGCDDGGRAVMDES